MAVFDEEVTTAVLSFIKLSVGMFVEIFVGVPLCVLAVMLVLQLGIMFTNCTKRLWQITRARVPIMPIMRHPAPTVDNQGGEDLQLRREGQAHIRGNTPQRDGLSGTTARGLASTPAAPGDAVGEVASSD
jgi:hypothetical protein